MGTLKYKGYIGTVEYSDQDDCLFGKVVAMTKDAITYQGQTIDELRADFQCGVDAYLESCAARSEHPLARKK